MNRFWSFGEEMFSWGEGGHAPRPPPPPPPPPPPIFQRFSCKAIPCLVLIEPSLLYQVLSAPPPPPFPTHSPTSALSQFSVVKTTVAPFTLCPLVSLYCSIQTADKAGPVMKETTPSKKRVRNTRHKGDKPKRRRIMTPDSEEEDSGGYLATVCLCKFKINTQGS